MPNTLPIIEKNFRLRLPQDGPLLGATHWSDDGQSIVAKLFATPDDSESDPALALLATYMDLAGKRVYMGTVRTKHPGDTDDRAPFFVLEADVPAAELAKGLIEIEVLTLHEIKVKGEIFHLPTEAALQAALVPLIEYDAMRATLALRLEQNRAMLQDPKPESHSFERRSDRSLDEAIVTLRLPPKTDKPAQFKFIATTCRYPGFAFESQRVDSASFAKIAKDHADATGILMLGDQIYADATASLFDNLTSIEKFQERYHDLFRSPGFANAVRRIPCYMTGDDHEFKNSWSAPDNLLNLSLQTAAHQSYWIYQLSHSPFAGTIATPPYDYSFTSGPVAVYVMDTLSYRDSQVPGEEKIVSDAQLSAFEVWLTDLKDFSFVILATGGVVAPGFKSGLDASDATDVHRAQGFENWQAFNGQRIQLLNIIKAAKGKKILLVSGDYHCAAMASIKNGGVEIAKAVVVPPAYAPMRYVNATFDRLALTELTSGFEINLGDKTDGSGYAVISIENGDWVVKFEVMPVADAAA